MAVDDSSARERVARVEDLLEAVDTLGDPGARATAMAAVQAVVELYGEGLERVLDHVMGVHRGLADALAGDELVSHLLFVHGLHPVDLQARVRRALDDVRPYLRSLGGDVELLQASGGGVRLRLVAGADDGCSSPRAKLELAVRDAVARAAPDVESVEVEGGDEPAVDSGSISLPVVAVAGASSNGSGS